MHLLCELCKWGPSVFPPLFIQWLLLLKIHLAACTSENVHPLGENTEHFYLLKVSAQLSHWMHSAVLGKVLSRIPVANVQRHSTVILGPARWGVCASVSVHMHTHKLAELDCSKGSVMQDLSNSYMNKIHVSLFCLINHNSQKCCSAISLKFIQ